MPDGSPAIGDALVFVDNTDDAHDTDGVVHAINTIDAYSGYWWFLLACDDGEYRPMRSWSTSPVRRADGPVTCLACLGDVHVYE